MARRVLAAATMSGRDEETPAFATQPLREEHGSLETVLDGLTTLTADVREGRLTHPLLLVGALAWLEAYERRHDQKVEAVLLPALRERDGASVADAGAVATLEHEQARRQLAALRRVLSGSRALNAGVCRLADECVAYLRTHAAHERDGLFAVADGLLSPADAGPLWENFRRVDERELRPGEGHALAALAAALGPRQSRGDGGHGHVIGVLAAHVMRPRPRAVRPADSLARAAELMDATQVRELPVVEDGRLCGIVSRGDLVPHLGHLEWTRVDAAMTVDPVVVGPERTAAAVTQVLLNGGFNAVPVVAHGGTLIGMVSRADVLRALADHANGDY